MDQPINLEDNPDRVVGKRTKITNPLTRPQRTIADAEHWRKVFGGVHIPKGVYRFKTHEEADEWLVKMLARPRK